MKSPCLKLPLLSSFDNNTWGSSLAIKSDEELLGELHWHREKNKAINQMHMVRGHTPEASAESSIAQGDTRDSMGLSRAASKNFPSLSR